MKIHDIQTIHLSEGTIEDMIDALSAQGINNPKTIEKVLRKLQKGRSIKDGTISIGARGNKQTFNLPDSLTVTPDGQPLTGKQIRSALETEYGGTRDKNRAFRVARDNQDAQKGKRRTTRDRDGGGNLLGKEASNQGGDSGPGGLANRFAGKKWDIGKDEIEDEYAGIGQDDTVGEPDQGRASSEYNIQGQLAQATTPTGGRKDTDAGGELLATAPNQGGDSKTVGGIASGRRWDVGPDDTEDEYAGVGTPRTRPTSRFKSPGELLATTGRKDTDAGGNLLATAPNQGGTKDEVQDVKKLAGIPRNADEFAGLGPKRHADEFAGLGPKQPTPVDADEFAGLGPKQPTIAGGSTTGNKEVTAVDDFSGTALAKPKASIDYAGGDPDVDATARTPLAPLAKQKASGTPAPGTGADGPAGQYANDRKQAMPAKTTQQAQAAKPILKAPADNTSPREGGILKKAGSNIGKAITSVTKQTGGREGSSFGDGSNPKVGNLLAKGTKMKTDKDLGIAPSPDRGDFNPAAAPAGIGGTTPKKSQADQDRAAANRKANAERERREMERNK